VLDIVAKSDVALASGHIHVSETWKVFEEAKRRGVSRLIFTHPEDIVGASLNDVKGIAAMGAYVEHSLALFLEGSKFRTRTNEDLRNHIEAAGVDQTIFCSDLGQVGTLAPVDGFRRAVALCLDLGYDDEAIHKMVTSNAAKALGLDAA
jgi:predicted TIM-barrel fold metal-dependent hydrolase